MRDFQGQATVRSANGPIEFSGATGALSGRAQNGPIAFAGRDATADLQTENGPIEVRLTGRSWGSGSLTARAQNGPVEVKVPGDYGSGVRVESSNHSPWSCRDACGGARRSWDDRGRSLELGNLPIVVHVSTVNGPVSVKRAK